MSDMVHNLPVLKERDEEHEFKPAPHLPSGKAIAFFSIGFFLVVLAAFAALVILKIVLLFPYWVGLGGLALLWGLSSSGGFYFVGRKAEKQAAKDPDA